MARRNFTSRSSIENLLRQCRCEYVSASRKSRLDSPNFAPDNVGDVLYGHIPPIVENHDDALVWRQCLQSLGDGEFDIDVGRGRIVVERRIQLIWPLPSDRVKRGSDRDGIEPRHESLGSPKPVDPGQNLDIDVLEHLFGQPSIAAYPQDQPV
jgi:hypothetical protein